MKFNDITSLSMNNLSHRGLRSWLTILGIVIGVAAVVSILSIVSGMQQSISSQLSGLGADILTVSPGFSRAAGMGFGGGPERMEHIGDSTVKRQNLTERDIQAIKSVSGVSIATGIVSGRVDITYLAESTSVSIRGVDPVAWKEITTSELASGRFLALGDVNTIVIGSRIANEMFKQPLLTNTQIIIEGKSFRIVGVLKESGGIGSGDDSAIFMPISTARTIIDNIGANQLSSIYIKVEDAGAIDEIIGRIEEKLMLSRHVTNTTKDYTIISAKAMQATISGVLDSLSLFLGGIAAISLFVGAIGIANTMYMSVVERTRQIGTLKALGTTNFEIMKLFLFESAMIGFIGGLLGIFLGFIASGAISEIGVRLMGAGMRGAQTSATVITPQLILFALGFSILIGMISGILPAKRAADLEPVEALRYE